jgi:hypothetical protein
LNNKYLQLEHMMNEQTRRELFSAMAMQAILAGQNKTSQTERADPGEVAQWARTYADALIAELMREQVAGGQ